MLGTYRAQALRHRAPSVGGQAWLTAAGLAFALVLTVAAVVFASERAQGSRASARAFPAALVQRVEYPAAGGGTAAGEYRQPADIALVDGWGFVLDTGNNRILELDGAGEVSRVLDGSMDERLALQGAMAMASDGRYLWVANSGASQVLALEPTGRVVKVLDLDAVGDGAAPPRPIGLAAGPNGDVFISDAATHRVLRYGSDGLLVPLAGSGARAGGSEGFNTPGGLALDQAGNVYVVDILNGRVVKLAPDGSFLRQFGRLGDTAGTLSRPKDVAVDSAGNVYVSDSLLASVQVFDPDGDYLGFIGREDPGDSHSASLFQAPAGLEIVQDRLYVVDRFAGLFAFRLPR